MTGVGHDMVTLLVPYQKSLTCRVGFFLHDLSEISYKVISPCPLTRLVLITVMCTRQ